MNYNFIKTDDIETKNYLENIGFKLISQEKNLYTFLNDNKLCFNNKNLKIQYSNILTV